MYNYSSKKQHDFCLHNNKILVVMMMEEMVVCLMIIAAHKIFSFTYS